MTQREFENRVGMTVSAAEYSSIEAVYMACDVDKDTYCAHWAAINRKRIQAYKTARKAAEEAINRRWQAIGLYHYLCTLQPLSDVNRYLNMSERNFVRSLGVSLGAAYQTASDLLNYAQHN